MLNKPKFMEPSTDTTNGVIDATNNQTVFSCVVDGTEAIYAWRIKIYSISDGKLVYDTGKIINGAIENQEPILPFYPINELGENNTLSIPLFRYQSIETENELQNLSEPYYWKIELWNDKDNTSDASGDMPTTTSYEKAFYANPKLGATLRCSYDYDNKRWGYVTNLLVLSQSACYFKCDVSPKDLTKYTDIKCYGWKITDIETGYVLIDTISKYKVYGATKDIICYCDNMSNNSSYSIEFFAETQNGDVVEVLETFNVEYEVVPVSNEIDVQLLKQESGVLINWKNTVVFGGYLCNLKNETVTVDNKYFKRFYPYNQDVDTNDTSIRVPKDMSVVWTEGINGDMDLPEDCTIVISTQVDSSEDIDLFYIEGTDETNNPISRKLRLTNGEFEYTVSNKDNTTLYKYPPVCKLNRYSWFVIIMSPMDENNINFTIYEFETKGSLYPQKILYPCAGLYPTFGTWQIKE